MLRNGQLSVAQIIFYALPNPFAFTNDTGYTDIAVA